MSIETPTALAAQQPVDAAADDASVTRQWVETALTVLFTATAVLFVSFLAVVTGIV